MKNKIAELKKEKTDIDIQRMELASKEAKFALEILREHTGAELFSLVRFKTSTGYHGRKDGYGHGIVRNARIYSYGDDYCMLVFDIHRVRKDGTLGKYDTISVFTNRLDDIGIECVATAEEVGYEKCVARGHTEISKDFLTSNS